MTQINTFKLEEYLAKYEFNIPYLLCCSDVETFSMKELLSFATCGEKDLWNNLSLGYTETRGLPKLRHTIATNFYTSFNEDNICCFAGAEEGIFCTLYTLCEKGDHIIVLTPCYQSLVEIPKMAGCEVTEVPLKEENEWRIDINSIEQAIKPNTKCLIINFPHNPTGQVITELELNELINVLDKHGIWLFADEVYRLLGDPIEGHSSPAACLYSKAISLGVMSKSFGLPGLRVGWIACQDKQILKKAENLKHYTSICNSAPSEILSLIAIENQEIILARNNKIVADNLFLLKQFFDQRKELFSWVYPQGGCIALVRFAYKEKIEIFCQKLAEQMGVLLIPEHVFELSNNYFRIGFGRKNMPLALDKLSEFLISYY